MPPERLHIRILVNILPIYRRHIIIPITLFISTAEAAFIAGLTDRQMHRIVDEHLIPGSLFEQRGNSRLFTRLGAAFATFYFATEDLLLASARRKVLDELSARVDRLQVTDQVLMLTLLDSMSWKVARKHVEVDVLPFLQEAFDRAKEVDQAQALVSTSPEIMGGLPVFAGTRVPVGMVLASVAAGIHLDRLQASYPFLTEVNIQAAKVYEAVHPRRGRPLRMAELNPELSRRVARVVKLTVSE